MKVKNPIRLIVSIVTIVILVALIVIFILNNQDTSSKQESKNSEAGTQNSENYSTEQQVSTDSKKEKLDIIIDELKNGNLFSKNSKAKNKNESIKEYELEEYPDVDVVSIIDESDEEYQEAVILVSYDVDEYDGLLLKFISRLEELKKKYGDKYGDLFRQNKNVSLKQEAGRVTFIVSKNASEIETSIRGIYDR
jgi:hypothetical protein